MKKRASRNGVRRRREVLKVEKKRGKGLRSNRKSFRLLDFGIESEEFFCLFNFLAFLNVFSAIPLHPICSVCEYRWGSKYSYEYSIMSG